MRHTNRQETTAPAPKRHKLDKTHKTGSKGTLHTHAQRDAVDANRVDGSKEVGMPHGMKTPKSNMPNKHPAHHNKMVAQGAHTAAGGTGYARKSVAAEQNGTKMFMAKKAVKAAKKRA
jgi:hypothetical protein